MIRSLLSRLTSWCCFCFLVSLLTKNRFWLFLGAGPVAARQPRVSIFFFYFGRFSPFPAGRPFGVSRPRRGFCFLRLPGDAQLLRRGPGLSLLALQLHGQLGRTLPLYLTGLLLQNTA